MPIETVIIVDEDVINIQPTVYDDPVIITSTDQVNLIVEGEFVENEKPSGVKNGVNKIFTTLSNFVPGTLKVTITGIRLSPGIADDFTETGPNQFTFTFVAPIATETILVDYKKLI
jgi:hypothetical protein